MGRVKMDVNQVSADLSVKQVHVNEHIVSLCIHTMTLTVISSHFKLILNN